MKMKKKKETYKIVCEWEMPIAYGTFASEEKAQKAIDTEDWEGYTGHTLQEVQEGGMVSIVPID